MVKKIVKILKKISIFDWILVAIGIGAIAVFSTTFSRKPTYITATVKIGEDSVYYSSWQSKSFKWVDTSGTKDWFADTFYKGQTEKDGLGNIKAEVTDVYSYNKSPDKKTVYINVKLAAVYNKATNTYTYKGLPVLIGSIIKLDLDNVHATGTTTNINGFPTQTDRTYIEVEAQIREENQTFTNTVGTKDYVANALKIGDEVKDKNGNVLIKILNKNVYPAKKTVVTSDGRVFIQNDPGLYDVFLTLGVYAEKHGDKYYLLDDTPLLIDQIIPINTSTISVFPVITRFIKK